MISLTRSRIHVYPSEQLGTFFFGWCLTRSSRVGLWFFSCPDTRMRICAYSTGFCSRPLAFSKLSIYFEVDHCGAVPPRRLSKLSCRFSRAHSIGKIWLVLPFLRLTYGFAPPAPRRTLPTTWTWFVARAAKTIPPRIRLFAGIARLLLTRTIPQPLLWLLKRPFRGLGVLLHWPVVLGP